MRGLDHRKDQSYVLFGMPRATLEHTHSQLIALPVIPKRVREEIPAAANLAMFRGSLCMIAGPALAGVLNSVLAEKANLVNAEAIASSRGLRIHESRKPHSSSGGSGSVLSVLLKTANGEHLVKGRSTPVRPRKIASINQAAASAVATQETAS